MTGLRTETPPYFSDISKRKNVSLHTGGIIWTAQLLKKADLTPGSRILEVGCGTGVTTHFLMKLGFDVTVVEICQELLSCCVDHCRSCLGRPPMSILGSIENFSFFGPPFDAAILECSLGFVGDKERSLSNLYSLLSSGQGKVLINDYYYHSIPPSFLTDQLRAAVGPGIATIGRNEYIGLFERAGFECVFWEDRHASRENQSCSGLPDAGEFCADSRAAKTRENPSWDETFKENRKYLRPFLSMWRKK